MEDWSNSILKLYELAQKEEVRKTSWTSMSYNDYKQKNRLRIKPNYFLLFHLNFLLFTIINLTLTNS
jgi:hypothetical protein